MFDECVLSGPNILYIYLAMLAIIWYNFYVINISLYLY